MPRDVMDNNKEATIYLMNSIVIELLSFLGAVASKELRKGFDDELYIEIKEEVELLHYEFLEALFLLRNKGLEFIEFVLHFHIFNDIDMLINRINEIDEIEFLYYFFGEDISMQQIREIREKPDRISYFMEHGLKNHIADERIARLIVFNTHEFIDSFSKTVETIKNKGFEKHIKEMLSSCNDIFQELKLQLEYISPLELCQKIMNKQFARVSVYKEYYFVPSFYIGSHHTRFFNSETLIMIITIQSLKNDNIDEDKLLEFLKIIGDKSRLSILRELANNKSYGSELSEAMSLNNATISHHLGLLKRVEVIDEEKDVQIKYYKTNINNIIRWFRRIERYIKG